MLQNARVLALSVSQRKPTGGKRGGGGGGRGGKNKKGGGVVGGWIELQGGLMVFNQLFLFCLQCMFCN